MNRLSRSLVFVCLVLPLVGARADVQVERGAPDTMRLSFWAGHTEIVEQPVIRFGREETMPAPRLDGADPDYSRFGAPALPFVNCKVLLPPSTRPSRVVITEAQAAAPFTLDRPLAFINQPYDGYDMTDPAQAQAWADNNSEDAGIYLADSFYPGEPVAFRARNFRGYTILDLSFTPFRYNPVRGVLQLSRHLELTIHLEPADGSEAACGVRDSDRDREIVRRMVVNGGAVDDYWKELPLAAGGYGGGGGGPGTNYYIIITSSALATNFEPLRAYHSYDADHHARIDTLEDIFALYPATNPAHQSIRSYVMDNLYPNGCDYVLLGGDVDVVTTYWGSADTSYSGAQIPVGRFSVETPQEIAYCIAKSTNPVASGTDKVLLIPRADEYGPTLVQYTNLFLPYMAVDTNSTLYSAPPINMFPAMDSHTIIWARGHGYYLYPHWGPSWYTPNNTNIQPFGINFGCSGAVIEWDEHPAEVYQNARYGNAAYIGTVRDVYANSFDKTFFETYFVRGTAPEPCVGDMMLADGVHSDYTLIGDPRFKIVSTQFHAKLRITTPPPNSFTRSYNIEDGTGYVESAVFRINSFNNCPWVITNISSSGTFSNHYAFSCLASNASVDVELSFLDVTNLAAGTYNLAWDVRDATNDFQIKSMSAMLIITDKNLLTDDDFVPEGTTNVLPAGAYVLIEDLVVGDGETVRLEPGVTLFTDWEYGGEWKIVVQPGGKLLALGSVTNQIMFSSPLGGAVPIEIHMTDLMPCSADFRYCYFVTPIAGSNRPVVSFINCTFSLGVAMPGQYIFPEPLEGTMKNCLLTAWVMGNYGEPGDLTGMDVSYTCISPVNTNMGWGSTPGVPIHHTYGVGTVWGGEFVGFDGRTPTLLSMCINAGDPASPPDPDGTRADIGAYYYDLSGAIRVTNDYPTVQQGLDAAVLVTAAVIVAGGEYRERIQFPVPMEGGIRLMGESETNRPVLILTNDTGDLVSFDGSGFIENFVLRHTGSNRTGRTLSLTRGGNVGLRNVEFSANRDNSTVLLLAETNDSPSSCLYMWNVDFVNNASNTCLLHIQHGLVDMFTSPWQWFSSGRFTNNTDIGTLFYFTDDEQHFPTRDLEFRGNQASTLVHNAAGGSASNTTLKFLNALFCDNIGDIRTEGTGHTLFENCTFRQNASNVVAAGNSRLELYNSIVWDNEFVIAQELGGEIRVDYTDINSAHPGIGTGNINTNPLFADAPNGDYHLLRESPGIDAGDSNRPYANEPEPDGSCIDLGRYGNTPEATSWKLWMVDVDIACPGNGVELTVQCASGSWYCTEFAESLFGTWTTVTNAGATGSLMKVVDPIATDQRFYRIHNYRP
ncbi:MAG: C25 family cysteine peptidase [bacterium]